MSIDYDFDREERRVKGKKIFFIFFRWIIALGAVILLAWAITEYAVEYTNMVDSSMEATLNRDDSILINKLAYVRNEPQRFDIIVFEKNGREHSFYSIKRIIGLPREKVKITDGEVYINGELLEEPMNTEPMIISGMADKEILLDTDEYFVLGDNRNESEDSRFANIGNVVKEEIIGTAWLRTNKFAIIDKLNMKAEEEESEDSGEEAEGDPAAAEEVEK